MELRVRTFEPLDVGLKALDVTSFDSEPRFRLPRRARELGLGDEELTLKASHNLPDLPELRRQLDLDEPEAGPELVERTVGADSWGIFVYARTAGESGGATVARPGVETRDTLASGRHGSWSKGELRPWTGQYEMCSTSLCLASCRHSRQMNPLRSLQAIPIVSILQPFPVPGG
jgi:hypothetical protein